MTYIDYTVHNYAGCHGKNTRVQLHGIAAQTLIRDIERNSLDGTLDEIYYKELDITVHAYVDTGN